MNGYVEFAKILKERDNPSGYSPQLGVIAELPNIKIKVGSKRVYSAVDLLLMFNITERDEHGRYIYLNKQVLLLPYGGKNIAVGVIL